MIQIFIHKMIQIFMHKMIQIFIHKIILFIESYDDNHYWMDRIRWY